MKEPHPLMSSLHMLMRVNGQARAVATTLHLHLPPSSATHPPALRWSPTSLPCPWPVHMSAQAEEVPKREGEGEQWTMGWISTQAFQSLRALLHSQHIQLLQRVQWRRLAHLSLPPQHPATCLLLQPVATTTPTRIALAPRALVRLAPAPIAQLASLVRPASQ